MNQAQSEYKHLLTFRVATKPVPIANPLNSAQLEGTAYHSSKLHPGPCSSARMLRRRWGTDTQTHRRPWQIYISPRLRLTRNV